MPPHESSANEQFDFGGRSYVSVSHRQSISFNSPHVRSENDIHLESADLADIGVVSDDSCSDPDLVDEYVPAHPPVSIARESYATTMPVDPTYGSSNSPSLVSPLLRKKIDSPAPDLEQGYGSPENVNKTPQPNALSAKKDKLKQQQEKSNFVVRGASFLPAVFLGTLLNVLDALSYGMIMFPLGEAVFSQMGPTGLSMFYVSTIVSQLVYSCGGLAFKSGIGSEMIEVTPFFHSMALSINANMTGQSQDAILTTVIFTYCISSVVTGIIFFLLGKLRLGRLVGFFPRHILVGCIGGVGYFLMLTGLEVTSRIEGGISYNWAKLSYLFGNYITILECVIPLVLTAVLILVRQRVHHSLLVPVFYICIFSAFHIIVAINPHWNLEKAREYEWVFHAVESNEPWYSHYQLFRFQLVDWLSIAREFPSMLALTFFGILHVPINVPALAVTVGMDQCDVDRELVAHGYSNAISGLTGSIQNYLVYTNSVLFIRAGADERIAGILLAFATAGVMACGPVVIGYIPICVVGSLIFLLGYELLKEALYDTWGKLRSIEYTTVVVIVVVMGAWDFVYGILVGILLASLSFVIEAARTPVVRGIYTGVVARSPVLRHPKQQEFLKDVGNQICVIKLQGTLFFGSIGSVEKPICEIFEKNRFHKNPIKYLIMDVNGVVSIDFSAAEGFRRILNLANDFNTQLIISSVTEDDDIVVALRDAGLWDTSCLLDIQLFNTLNYALEWCENSFLKTYNRLLKTESHVSHIIARNSITKIGSSAARSMPLPVFDAAFGTPRSAQVYQAASKTFRDEQRISKDFFSNSDKSFKTEPLQLIMITFSGLSDKDEQFWCKLAPFFVREKIPPSVTFYDTIIHSPSFFILESGLVKYSSQLEEESRKLQSSILPRTAFGDLLKSSEFRRVTFATVNETVLWRLREAKLKTLVETSEGQFVYNELLIVQTKLIKERFDSLTANLVITA